MSKYLVDSTDMTAIADAIRSKDGTQTTMTVSDMPTRIQNIPSGGGTDYLALDINNSSYSYVVPDTVVRIRSYAFAESGINSITIPNTVTRIGNNAFMHCWNLTSIVLPTYLDTGIGDYTFHYCINLQSVTLPSSGSKVIGNNAFGSCQSLTTINNMSSGWAFGPYAFDNTALEGDLYVGNEATFRTNCFNNNRSTGMLYIHLSSETPQRYNIPNYGQCFDTNHCRLVVPYSVDHLILSAYQNTFPEYSSIMIEENH